MHESGISMIDGITVTMGGKEWAIPPLTLGQLRQLMPRVRQLSEIGENAGETQIALIVEIVTAALRRNYPEINEELVENLLDLGNAVSVLTAVLTGSGLKPRVPPSGESIAPEHGSGAIRPTGAATAGETSTGC
jgi:hypothetical protein